MFFLSRKYIVWVIWKITKNLTAGGWQWSLARVVWWRSRASNSIRIVRSSSDFLSSENHLAPSIQSRRQGKSEEVVIRIESRCWFYLKWPYHKRFQKRFCLYFLIFPFQLLFTENWTILETEWIVNKYSTFIQFIRVHLDKKHIVSILPFEKTFLHHSSVFALFQWNMTGVVRNFSAYYWASIHGDCMWSSFMLQALF